MPDASDDAHRILDPRCRPREHEFLTTDEAKYVMAPHPLAADLSEIHEHGVASIMSVFVVDGLEAVDVDHGNTQTVFRAATRRERVAQ